MAGFVLQTALLLAFSAQGQQPLPHPENSHPESTSGSTPAKTQASESERERAEKELKKQEQQRILRIIPDFNTVTSGSAVKLSPGQKFRLAFRGATDPFTFAAAGMDAGLSQWQNEYPGYGQGASGYAKRLGASYADSFNGTMLGNAVFPVLLHQDPRYFRKGNGSFFRRVVYALSSSVICKGDNGHWQPNYSNLLGNLAAGGISNVYYPSADRGAGLTFERALTVTAEGAAGAIVSEFWPDISQKMFGKRKQP